VWLSVFLFFLSFLIFEKKNFLYVVPVGFFSPFFFFLIFKKKLCMWLRSVFFSVFFSLFYKISKKYIPFFACGCRFFSLFSLFFLFFNFLKKIPFLYVAVGLCLFLFFLIIFYFVWLSRILRRAVGNEKVGR
jgi:hypothetical protein